MLHAVHLALSIVALSQANRCPCRCRLLPAMLVAWSSIPVASRGTSRTQGVPFFCAGDELLRSKSFDRDSYASGDWFNAIMYDGSVRANKPLQPGFPGF